MAGATAVRELVRRVLTVSAVLVTLVVVVLLIFRFSWLYLGGREVRVQELLGNYLQRPVQIESLNASWHGWDPQLDLSGITLPSSDPELPPVQIQQLHLRLSLLSLLISDNPFIRGAYVDGVQLSLPAPSVSLPTSLDVMVPSVEAADPQGAPKEVLALASLLRQIQILHVRNIQLSWLRSSGDVLQWPDLELAELHYRHRFRKHHLQIQVQPPPSHAQALQFRFSWQGDPLLGEQPVQIYAQGQEVQLESWLQQDPVLLEASGLHLDSARFDLEGWGSWRAGKLRWMRLRTLGDITLDTGGKSLQVQDLAAWWSIDQRRAGGRYWGLKVDRMHTDAAVWPAFALRALQYPDGRRWDAHLSRFPLDRLHGLLPFLPPLPQQEQQWLQAHEFSGELRDLRARLHLPAGAQPKFALNLELADVALRGEQVYQWDGLQGRLRFGTRGGAAELQSGPVEIDLPRLLAHPLDLETMEFRLAWFGWDTDQARVLVQPIQAQVDGGKVELHADLQWRDKALSGAGLFLKMKDLPVQTVTKRLPLTLPDVVHQTVQQILPSGNVDQGTLLYRHSIQEGKRVDYDRVDRFQFYAELVDAEINLGAPVPPLQQVHGWVLFDGFSLQAGMDNGLWLHSSVAGTQLQYADLRKPRLQGQLYLAGDLKDVHQLLAVSGMSRSHGWNYAGDQQLVLDVAQDAERKFVLHSGKMQIEGGTLHNDKDWGLREIVGELQIDDGVLRARELQARYQGFPVHLDLDLQLDPSSPALQFALRGNADATAIREELHWHWPEAGPVLDRLAGALSGETGWQAELHYQPQQDDRLAAWDMKVRSDLSGLRIDLPAPLGKAEASPIDNMQLKLRYQEGSLHTAALDYDGIQLLWESGLAADEAQSGWQLHGEMPEFSMAGWSEWLTSGEPMWSDEEQGFAGGGSHLQLDLKVSRLELFGNDYTNLTIKKLDTATQAQIRLHSDQLIGALSIPPQDDAGHKSPWKLDIEHWYLPEAAAKEEGESDWVRNRAPSREDSERPQVDPRRIPELDVRIEQIHQGDELLGSVQLQSRKQPQGLDFPVFELQGEGLSLNGSGSWLLLPEGIQTALRLDIKADVFNSLSRLLGEHSDVIVDGGGALSLDMRWPGSPADYQLLQMEGSLNVDLGKGQLNFGSGGTWLLGLLNLNGLLRFMALDFSQLLSNKVKFDSIKGTFDLQDGNAHTQDLKLIGPTLDMHLTGRSGLMEQDYDQSVTVVPHLSDSLPWVSLIFGPAGIGAGLTWHIFGEWSGIPQRMDQVFMRKYRITGSWEEPQVESEYPDTASAEDAAGPGSVLQDVLSPKR